MPRNTKIEQKNTPAIVWLRFLKNIPWFSGSYRLKYLSCSNNPLEKLIIYADNEMDMDDIESEYGDIIEYEY